MSWMASRSKAKLTTVAAIRHQLSRDCSTQPSPRTATYFIVGGDRRPTNNNNHWLQQPNKKFPFPGDVCTHTSYQLSKLPPLGQSVLTVDVDELLKTEDEQLTAFRKDTFSKASGDKEMNDSELQLTAIDCPKLLKKDLASLFPDQTMKDETKLTVLNVSQKTSNDMAAWTAPMELERDQLTSGFIDSAMSICATLKKDGYWADFIDPSSGRPYLGRFTNATLFDTDERYNQLGFKVEDLGCCRVIKHLKWGSKVLVGTIFTNAPTETSAVQRLLDKMNAGD